MHFPIQLSDEQWDTLLLAVPRLNPRDRTVFEAVLHIQSTGLPWEDLPEDYGITSRTVWNKHRQWQQDGSWEKAQRVFLQSLPAETHLHWEQAFREAEVLRHKKTGRKKRPQVQWVLLPALIPVEPPTRNSDRP